MIRSYNDCRCARKRECPLLAHSAEPLPSASWVQRTPATPKILEPVRRETSVALSLPQQLRQPRDVDRNPPRLVLRQQLRLKGLGRVVARIEIGPAAAQRAGAPTKKQPELASVIAELRAAGIMSLSGIAAAFNARGVRMTWGHRHSYASQVAQFLRRLEG
jgi:hypothetical protein